MNFESLESKLVPPIFIPSNDKINFDATYDIEELLFEEAPPEARARKQKSAELRQNATTKEIRQDELHRMIEAIFEPYDYTMAYYEATAAAAPAKDGTVEALNTTRSTESQPSSKAHSQSTTPEDTPPISPSQSPSYGSWSNLADRTTTLPVDAAAGREGKESGSVLGFLRGKKTRDRTPKPKEAGVLGKAGARHIIS